MITTEQRKKVYSLKLDRHYPSDKGYKQESIYKVNGLLKSKNEYSVPLIIRHCFGHVENLVEGSYISVQVQYNSNIGFTKETAVACHSLDFYTSALNGFERIYLCAPETFVNMPTLN